VLKQKALKIGTVAGIHIVVHRVWFLFFLGLTVWLAQVTLPRMLPGWAHAEHWKLAALLMAGETATALVHELSHSLMAVAHNRRVYSITLYGFAAATHRESRAYEGAEGVLIALAGPLSHFVLASVFWGLFMLAPQTASVGSTASLILAVINIGIGLLNLLPFAPLDGRRALLAMVANQSAHRRTLDP
jgi:Zn-dependent protease